MHCLITLVSALLVVIYTSYITRKFGSLKPKYISGLPLKFIKLGFVYAIALFVLNLGYRIDVIIMERLSTVSEVGLYSIGVNVAEMLWLVPAAISTVNFARSAASADPRAYARKSALVLRITLWGALIPFLGLYILAPQIIPLIYGNSYLKSGYVVQAILPGIWIALIFKVLNSDLAGRGHPEAAFWVYGFALLVNISLNFWLIPTYGAVGAAWASSVSYTVGALIFANVYAKMSEISISELIVPNINDFHLLSKTILNQLRSRSKNAGLSYY